MQENEHSETHITGWILNNRWLTIIAALALIAITAISLPKLSKDTSADAFIDPASPALLSKERMEEVFGLTDPIVVAIINKENNGIFNAKSMALVDALTTEIKALKQVDPDRVVSLATENHIVGTEDGLIVEGFFADKTDYFQSQYGSDERAVEIREAIADVPLYQGRLVGRPGTATLITAEILGEDAAEAVYEAVVEIVERATIPDGTEVHIAGEGAVAGYLSSYIDKDASRLNPLAGIIITLVLLGAFMSLKAAVLPNIVVAATVLGSFGLMAASETSFYVITNGLVVNLIGISVADSIHILSAYYAVLREAPQTAKQAAVKLAVSRMARPITLTSLTTIAGFLALSVSSSMPPIQAFGLFGAIGVALAWVYSLTLLPVLMTLWPGKRIPRSFRSEHRGQLAERLVITLGQAVLSKPKLIVATGIGVGIVAIIGALLVIVEEDRIENFQPSEAIYLADKTINANTDGIYNLDILVETDRDGGLYDPEILRRIEALQRYAETLPNVGGSTSIVDYIKQLHRSVNEGKPQFYSIPSNSDLIAQLFFLYGASADPSDFEEEVDHAHRQALVRLQVKEGRYSNNKRIVPQLEQYLLDEFNNETLKATVTGRVTVSYYWIRGIERSTLYSILLSFTAVTLTAILVFRSVVSGLLAAIPVGLAILLVYAVMGLSGVHLGVSTSMFAAIAIGLSIDFAIHALDRLREIGRSHGLNANTLANLYPETGRALFFNFVAVAGGFAVLMSSQVPPLIKFGGLVAVAVSVAFLASVTLLPALVLLIKPHALQAQTHKENSNAPIHNAA